MASNKTNEITSRDSINIIFIIYKDLLRAFSVFYIITYVVTLEKTYR